MSRIPKWSDCLWIKIVPGFAILFSYSVVWIGLWMDLPALIWGSIVPQP